MSTVQKVVERCRRALLIETFEDMEVAVKIDEAVFTVTFSSGETINLSRKTLKDEWENLRAELASAKQKLKPDGGDAKSSKISEAKVDSDNITDSDEERLLADPDGGTTEKTVDTEIENIPPRTTHNLGDDIARGVSPEATEGGPGENEDHRKDSNDSVEQENNQDKEQTSEKPMQMDNSQSEKMVNLEGRLDNKIQHLERMMSATINLHSKMQDNLKLWLRQRELDDERAKKPRIESIVTLSPNSKITTGPRTLTKTTSTLNDSNKKLVEDGQSEHAEAKTGVTNNTTGSSTAPIDSHGFANQVTEAIKIQLIGKDSGTKHDYKLEPRVKYEHFYEFLASELRTIDLMYVIDKTVAPPEGLNDNLKEKHRFKVRDILINRVDKFYHTKILQIKDPVEMLNKLKEFKRCEVNVTSVSVRKQLYSIQYNANRETAMQFMDRFEEIVHNYESIQGSTPLSNDEKRDALYNAIMNQVPEVQSVEFITKNQTGKGLTYDLLKSFLLQAEANRVQTTTSNHPGTKNSTMGSASLVNTKQQTKWVNERCYECDDYGHMKNECPRKGQGLRKCYECQRFTTHKAYECPQRVSRQGNGSGRGGYKARDDGKRQWNKENDSNAPKHSKNKKDNTNSQQNQSRTGTSETPTIHFANHQQNNNPGSR